MEFQTRQLAVGPLALCVAEAGKGGRPLLLIHGFNGAKEDFTTHLPAMAAAGWHAVAPDLRGHGASDAPEHEDDYTLEILAGDVLGLARALGWDRFALLGHSMGGMVAQVVALGAPERLGALVLVGTGPGPVEIDRSLALGSVEIVRSSGMSALVEAIAALPGGSPLNTDASRRVRQSRPSPLGGDDPVASWEAFGDAKMKAASPVMYAAMVPAMLDQHDRLPALARLSVPTLVVVGEEDSLFLSGSRRMAAAIPGARLCIIPGAGHNPQHENPAEWENAVLGFLGEVAARPGSG